MSNDYFSRARQAQPIKELLSGTGQSIPVEIEGRKCIFQQSQQEGDAYLHLEEVPEVGMKVNKLGLTSLTLHTEDMFGKTTTKRVYYKDIIFPEGWLKTEEHQVKSLTQKEEKVLQVITDLFEGKVKSGHTNPIDISSVTIEEMSTRSVKGVVTSMVNKGIMEVAEDGKIFITKTGKQVWEKQAHQPV